MSDVFKSAEWARQAEQRERERRELERLNKNAFKSSELPPDPWGFRTVYITEEQATEYLKKFYEEE